MRKIFFTIFLAIFFVMPIVHEEIKNFTGEGYFAVVDETLDYAKNKAKLDAARNIAEQIFVDIQSKTEVKNSTLIHDEIITKTESLMKILDVKYKIEPGDENSFVVKAIVTAIVDTDEIDKLLENREENLLSRTWRK